MRRKTMRLLVLGDENVGKSSLIHAIYSEVSSNVEKTLKKVILPPEMCLYSKQVFTELIDTNVDVEIIDLVNNSDLILLVYDVSDLDTIDRLESDWLPRVHAIDPKVPIILVGNKMDKKELQFEQEQEYIKIKDILKKVTRRYKNVQMGIECSAFYDRNVKSVLNCAQRAVLYPLSPLYNLEQKQITPHFRKALVRIFRILDQDLDGRLHDSEMNALQERVFQSELNVEDIRAIKEIILRELEIEQQDYIEMKGFIALQKKCIEMLKIQICWSILRYFHYDDQLRLRINTDYFILDEYSGESVELSSEAINFLIRIYNFCKKNSTLVQPRPQSDPTSILESIFESCPEVRFSEFMQNNMGEEKFLTAWSLYAFVDYKRCYEDLSYLGFEHSADEAFSRRKVKRTYTDFLKLKDNKVFSVLLLDSEESKLYLDPLFSDGQKVTVQTRDGDTFVYERTSRLFSNQLFSKTFLLFRLPKANLEQFLTEVPFARKLDIVLEFPCRPPTTTPELLPGHLLYRSLSPAECTELLRIEQPPPLDLSMMPVQYNEATYSALYTQVYLIVQNIELGLTREKVRELKELSEQKKNLWVASGLVAMGLGVLMGGYLYKKGWARLWN